MTEFQNDYGPYLKNLALVNKGEVATIRDHNHPDPGFYRGRNKEKELEGYAYWYEGGADVHNLRCERNGKLIDPEVGYRIWPHLGTKPIEQEWYFGFLETGRWPDVSAAAQDDRAIEKSKDVDPYSIEGLTARLDTLEANAKTLLAAGVPKEKAAADILADVKNTAGKIEKALETGCKAATTPLQAQISEIKNKWEPVRVRAENLKVDVGKVVTLYINAENKRRSDAAAAEENARLEREAAARRANMPVEESKPIEAPKGVTVGSHGRKMAARAVWIPNITDRAAFLKHCENMPIIQEALEKVATSYARHERPAVPGLEYTETAKAV